MLINNPKSLAGFNRNDQEHDSDYQLATVGQVATAIRNLDNRIKTLLNGTISDDEGRPVDYINRAIDDKMGGLYHGKGYAWINQNTGKIDESLLPSLAITETYVVGIGEILKKGADPNGNIETIYKSLDLWCKDQSVTFQKGDIIIVTFDSPGQLDEDKQYLEIPSASYTTDGLTNINDTQDGFAPKLNANAQYLGTYIITKCPADRSTEPFLFAKMAYTDSNIISINSIAPKNSAGQMTLYLRDILAAGRDATRPAGMAQYNPYPTDLERVIFSLSTTIGVGALRDIEDGGNHYERFSFKSLSNDNQGNTKEFGYATLNELDAEAAKRAADDEYLSGVISAANVDIDSLSGVLGERYSETQIMSPSVFIEKSATSATVFNQLEALRFSIDYNANMLDIARSKTATYLAELYKNIDTLYTCLNGKAVAFIEKSFTWNAGEGSQIESEIGMDNYFYNSLDPALYQNSPNANQKIKGIVHWTHVYWPSESTVENTADETIIGNQHFSYPNVQIVKNANGSVIGSGPIYSDERIVAVFDENGNKIDVDIKRVPTNDSHHIPGTQISVDTDLITDENGTILNSLAGSTWKLLIAKTIVDIPIDFTDGRTVDVGIHHTSSSNRNRRLSETPSAEDIAYAEAFVTPQISEEIENEP